jgi:hypothetical protein
MTEHELAVQLEVVARLRQDSARLMNDALVTAQRMQTAVDDLAEIANRLAVELTLANLNEANAEEVVA